MVKNLSFCGFLQFFGKKIVKKMWKNICFVCTMLIFSTWKGFDGDLNAGRRGTPGQLHVQNQKRHERTRNSESGEKCKFS